MACSIKSFESKCFIYFRIISILMGNFLETLSSVIDHLALF